MPTQAAAAAVILDAGGGGGGNESRRHVSPSTPPYSPTPSPSSSRSSSPAVRRGGVCRRLLLCCCCCCCRLRPWRRGRRRRRGDRGRGRGLEAGAGDPGAAGALEEDDEERRRRGVLLSFSVGERRSRVTDWNKSVIDALVLETLSVIRTLVDNEQEPPPSMRKLNAITEQESGWLAVISSMVEVIPMEDPLGPANITLLLDDCPLPSKETIHKLVELLGLTPVDWSARKWDANRHQNVAIVLGCLAEKLAGPRSIELFSEHILDYLLANMTSHAHPSVIMYSLVAMEKFAQTSENKVTIQRRLAREEEHPLLSLEVLASEEDCPRRQVGFCARWSLDNLFLLPDRTFSYLEQDMSGVNAILNDNDVSEYLKIGPDGLEARCDAPSFESVRCTHQVRSGAWYYEVTVITSGIMQIGWATKDSKFLNYEGYGIGDDDKSVAFDGCRQLLWHDAVSQPVEGVQRWLPGDIVGSVLDLENGLVGFYHNGSLAVAFDGIFRKERGDEDPLMGFFAAASFMSFQQCRFNFGSEPFAHHPGEEWPPAGWPPPSPAPGGGGKEAGKRRAAREASTTKPVKIKSFNESGTLSKDEKVILPRHLRLEELRKSSVPEGACTLCFDRVATSVLEPCGHGGLCERCALQLESCPMCRAAIVRVVSAAAPEEEEDVPKDHEEEEHSSGEQEKVE